MFPTLVAAEREAARSCAGCCGARCGAAPHAGSPGTWSAREGLGGLAAVLASRLGAALRLGTRVHALVPEAQGWRRRARRAARSARGAVVLAADAEGAAALLAPLDAEAAALRCARSPSRRS